MASNERPNVFHWGIGLPPILSLHLNVTRFSSLQGAAATITLNVGKCGFHISITLLD